VSKAKKAETAIVTAPQLQVVKEESPVRTIMKRIENVRELHRFINQNLNVALKKRMKQLPKGAKLDDRTRTDLEIDFGTIPGSKPFLKQPGAEKILRWAYSRPEYDTHVDNLENGHIEVISRVKLRATADGTEVFSGPMCSCSSMESNFRFRWLARETQPSREDKEKLKKLGVGRMRKETSWKNGQRVEEWVWQDRIENPNIFDERNNVRQRSEKRALVKCVRQFVALSEIFTTDPNDWDAEAVDQEIDYEPQGRVVMESTEEPIDVPAQPESQPDPFWPTITIDWTDEAKPLVTGDAETFKPLFDAYCKWGADGFWHTEPRHAEPIRQAAKAMHFKLEEIVPKVSPRPFEDKNDKAKGAAQSKAISPAQAKAAPKVPDRKEEAQAASAVPSVSAEPQIVSGTIQHFTEKMTKGSPKRPSTPYLNVLLKTEHGDRWYSLFDRDLFEYVSKAKGKSGEFYFTQHGEYYNILGFKTLAGREFESGKIPVVQRNEERGGQLFK
jgi:hypothetical protein